MITESELKKKFYKYLEKDKRLLLIDVKLFGLKILNNKEVAQDLAEIAHIHFAKLPYKIIELLKENNTLKENANTKKG